MALMIENPDAPNIDPDTYTLRISKPRLVEVNDFNDPNSKVSRLELTFTILDETSWEGSTFTDLFSLSDGPRSKLGQVARAAFKTDQLPRPWDAEDLDGKRIRAGVKLRDSGYNGVVTDTISAIKPQRKQAAIPVSQPDEDEDDDVFDDVFDDLGPAGT